MKNKTSLFSILLLCCSVSMLTFGCDDGDGGGNGGGGSSTAATADLSASVEGAESETALEDLSEEQAVSLCEAQKAYAESQISSDQAKRAGCITGAIFAASFAMGEDAPSCEDVYASCLNGEGEEVEQEETLCADKVSTVQGCSATISELEACAEEQVNGLIAFSSLTCADLSDTSALAMSPTEDTMSACAVVAEKCPDLQ